MPLCLMLNAHCSFGNIWNQRLTRRNLWRDRFLQKIVVRKTLTNLLKLWPRSRTIDTQTLFALSTDFLPTLNFTKQIYTNLRSNRPTHTRRMNDLFARVLTFEIVCGMRQERVTRVACAHGKTEVQLICCSSKRERVVDSIIKMPTEPFKGFYV